MVGPTVITDNLQNFNQLSLGNEVWNDADNNGLFNSNTEVGVVGATLNLYSVPNASSTFSAASDTLRPRPRPISTDSNVHQSVPRQLHWAKSPRRTSTRASNT